MASLDHKYTGEIRKADTGELVPNDEWIVFRAKDDAVPAMLRWYHAECKAQGSPEAHLDAIALLHLRVIKWREAHPDQCKVPD